jgi:hypothetical protein
MESGKLRDTCLIKQNKRTEGRPITAVLRQARFGGSFDAFCVYFNSAFRIKCSAKIPTDRKAAKRLQKLSLSTSPGTA